MNSNKDIAILIPFRNEEKNLGHLLTQIDRIGGFDYANVFLIDDHSTDDSLKVIRAHSKCGKLKILSCQEGVYGKKRALEKGVIESGGKWILTWDCDIQLEKFDWMVLEELISNNVELAVLPVRMKSGNGFFGLFQQAEWRILQYWTFLALRYNQPIMANGANLFFTSNLFLNQPQRNYLFSSGDDMNMLHEAIQVKGKIEGVDIPSNAINIYPVDSLATYCQQRWRWAGKIRKYPITSINYMSVLFSIWNFLILFAIVYSFFEIYFLFGLIALLLTQISLIGLHSRKYGEGKLVLMDFILGLCYPFISLFFFVTSLFIRPVWKGRRLSLKNGI